MTGGAGGIGGAVVRSFAAAGHPVTLTHLGDAAAAAALLAEVRALSPEAEVTAMESDAGDEGAVAEVVAAVRPLVVVHAAGFARDGVVWKQDVADLDAMLRVHVRGAWLLLHHAAPVMRAAGFGRFVFLGSINGLRGKFGQTAYAAAKAALGGMARSAARELGRFGVTVNVVAPGWVDTPLTAGLPPKHRERARAECPTGRLTTPEDVAAVVAFLASDLAGQVTGHELPVDGGQLLGMPAPLPRTPTHSAPEPRP